MSRFYNYLESDMSRYIAIEGPIGVGKTSLVKLIGNRYQTKKLFDISTNPFLADFYADRPGSAFSTQLHFLIQRYQQLQQVPKLLSESDLVFSDYLFAKDKIFACLNLDDEELRTYDLFYNTLSPTLRPPDLVIYLQAPLAVLQERIKLRQIAYEKDISEDYLSELIEAYDHFFSRYKQSPLTMIKTTEIDFVHRHEDLENLMKIIFRSHISGVQPFSTV